VSRTASLTFGRLRRRSPASLIVLAASLIVLAASLIVLAASLTFGGFADRSLFERRTTNRDDPSNADDHPNDAGQSNER
jgi:hypothetical protein